MNSLKKPWLLLSPEWAHELSHWALPIYSFFNEQPTPEWHSLQWQGLDFKNPMGIAGGVDKNAEHVSNWSALGCGFIEIGTVTPRRQTPNPGKIMDRSIELQAMWNKMGFPSAGADEVYDNLLHARKTASNPIFVNIGKNRDTPNEKAAEDYLYLIHKFHDVADCFVVNISSPNTQGLRNLQNKEQLQILLQPLVKAAAQYQRPLLVKLSPDMTKEAFQESLLTCQEAGVHGFVLTNTTLSRPTSCSFPTEGGLSGAPLQDLSKKSLRLAIETLGESRKNLLLVSVGGIMSPQEAYERLQMGADLVQIYSGLIFHGLDFFHDAARRYNGRR